MSHEPYHALYRAHPPLGEEVMAVDEVDVDVGVGHGSVDNTPDKKERMG